MSIEKLKEDILEMYYQFEINHNSLEFQMELIGIIETAKELWPEEMGEKFEKAREVRGKAPRREEGQ